MNFTPSAYEAAGDAAQKLYRKLCRKPHSIAQATKWRSCTQLHAAHDLTPLAKSWRSSGEVANFPA